MCEWKFHSGMKQFFRQHVKYETWIVRVYLIGLYWYGQEDIQVQISRHSCHILNGSHLEHLLTNRGLICFFWRAASRRHEINQTRVMNYSWMNYRLHKYWYVVRPYGYPAQQVPYLGSLHSSINALADRLIRGRGSVAYQPPKMIIFIQFLQFFWKLLIRLPYFLSL